MQKNYLQRLEKPIKQHQLTQLKFLRRKKIYKSAMAVIAVNNVHATKYAIADPRLMEIKM